MLARVPNPMSSILSGETDTHTQSGSRDEVSTEADTGVKAPEAKSCHQALTIKRGQGQLLPVASGRRAVLLTC